MIWQFIMLNTKEEDEFLGSIHEIQLCIWTCPLTHLSQQNKPVTLAWNMSLDMVAIPWIQKKKGKVETEKMNINK